MNKRRLLKLAELLDEDAKNKKGIQFNLMSWGRIGDENRPISCGTYGCAMGLAVVSGAFSREGLRPPDTWGGLAPRLRTNGRTYSGYLAAQKLFDIKPKEAEFLFSANSYEGRINGAIAERRVAKRIRSFIAGKVAA